MLGKRTAHNLMRPLLANSQEEGPDCDNDSSCLLRKHRYFRAALSSSAISLCPVATTAEQCLRPAPQTQHTRHTMSSKHSRNLQRMCADSV